MFDSLARLADGNARRVGLFAIAFFLLAGALGGSVASRLDPYGADDPATEAVKARNQLSDAGLRVPAVLAVVSDAPISSPATRRRVERLERDRAPSRRRRLGNRLLRHPLPASSSPTTAARPTSPSRLKPTEDKAWQEAGADIADRLSSEPGVVVGGAAVAQEQVNKQVEKDLRMAELLAFPLLFLLSLLFFRSLVASVLPLMIGGLAIVGTFLILRLASEFGSISIFALNLTTGARPRAGDRLQPLRRLPLPRGDRQGRPGAGGDAAGDGDRRAHRALLLADGRRRARLAARLPAALPLLDGARRRPRRALRGG